MKVTIIIDKAIPETPPAPQEKVKSKYSITLKSLESNEHGAKPEYKMFNGKSILEATPALQNQTVLKLRTLAQENENESEYKSNDETPWQESNVFKNLIPNKEYTFYSRYAATEDRNFAPSLTSEPIKIRTLKKSSQEPEKEAGEISDGETKKVEYEGGTANVTVNKNGDVIEITMKDENGKKLNTDGKINLALPYDDFKPGTVLVKVNPDGSAEVIRKSVTKDGKIYLPASGSGKFKIIDNSKIFSDVSQNHWAYDAVLFVSAHELFNGTAPNIFELNTPMSRAMMLQVLHNLENNPYQAFEKIFSDVDFDDWFAEAITWAAKNNLVTGYNDGNFGANDSITREQLATIIYRYFSQNEIVDTELNFVDADLISDYAIKALRWAVKYEIVQGKGNNILDPKGLATRVEVAQMFLKSFVEFAL